MSLPVYSVEDVANMTHMSTRQIYAAINQDASKLRKEDGALLPKLRAKQGTRNTRLILANDLVRWLEELPDV